MKLFVRDIANDPERLRKGCLHPRRGLHQFYRLCGRAMQKRFAELVDPATIPTAFIHGNPHLENYAKTERGAAMVDFDRSRLGPYAYDIVRFMVSLSIRRAHRDHRFLHPVVLANFRRGYVYGAHGLGHEGVGRLLGKSPKKWQLSTRAYMAADGPWAQRLREHAIDREDPRIAALIQSYFASRHEEYLLDEFDSVAAGEIAGSMGKKHLVVLLDPHDSDADQRLVDIKETYDDPDDPWFKNPFDHNGERMVAAGELHAPGWEINPGFASHDGAQYWCREIPTQKLKLKTTLPEFEQVDVAFAVATQLGYAHRDSMDGIEDEEHLGHFEDHFETWVEVARNLDRELEISHGLYLRDLFEAEDEEPSELPSAALG